MRLHLLIDAPYDPMISADDIVLVSRNNHSVEIGGNVMLMDSAIANEAESVGENMRKLYSNFNEEFNKTLNTTYVSFFLPIETVLRNVEAVLSTKDIKEIVLYEGAKEPFFKSENAEGEGTRKHYKTNWMANPFVYSLYSGKVNISWKRKDKNAKISFLCRWYHIINLVRLLTIRIVKRIKSKRNKGFLKKTGVNYIVSIISLALQKRHIDSIFDSTENSDHIYFSYNESLVDYSAVYPVMELPIKTLLRTYIDVMWKYYLPNRLKYYNVTTKNLARELRFCQFRYEVYKKRLLLTMSFISHNEARMILSNTTVGDDMMAIHEVSHVYNLHHVNLQYVSMERILYPNLELADEYYIYARRTFELYKDRSNSFRLYLPIKEKRQRNPDPQKCIFVVFTQPDSLSKDYIYYLKTLCAEIERECIKVEIIIKPHYRQTDIADFERFAIKYDFVSLALPNDSVDSLLKKADGAMSINSSVLFESMMNYVLTIIYNPNGKYDDTVYNNDFCFPEVNYVTNTPQETIMILKDIKEKQKEFENKVDCFIQSSQAITNIKEILKN